MSTMNTSTGWGWPARLLHWVMAFMVLAMMGFGFYMANIETDIVARFEMVQRHKSLGFVVFVLAIVRVVWRWTNKTTPELPADMPGWQVTASHVSHKLLYILIFWMPLSGWLMASASPLNNADNYPARIANKVFGLFELPDPFPVGTEALANTFHTAHWIGALLLALVLLTHLGAALKHHFVERDRILMRMIKGR